MNVKLPCVVCEETVGLVAPVVLGAETPVHVGKHGLLFEVYCTKDTAAYFESLLSRVTVVKNETYQLLAHFCIKTMERKTSSAQSSTFLRGA